MYVNIKHDKSENRNTMRRKKPTSVSRRVGRTRNSAQRIYDWVASYSDFRICRTRVGHGVSIIVIVRRYEPAQYS